MIARALIAAAWALLATQDPLADVGPARPDPRVAQASPDAAAPAPLALPADGAPASAAAAYESALAALAARFPERVTLRTIGESREGLAIRVLVVSDAGGADDDSRPGLLLCGELGARLEDEPARITGDAVGPLALVRRLGELLERAGREPELAALLDATSLYLVAAPEPDRWFEPAPERAAPGARRVLPDRNFPAGWEPERRGGGASGAYPLSEPESRALAAFLRAQPNVAGVLVVPLEGPERLAGNGANAVAPLALRAAQGAELPAGGFARHCAQLAGAAVFRDDLSGGRVVEALRALPRLALGPATVERLRESLWVVDLPVENEGLLATAGPDLRARWSGASARFRVGGARLVSAATREPGGAAFRPARVRADGGALLDLEGGARELLRVVVEAPEGAVLEVELASLRAGTARASVPLR